YIREQQQHLDQEQPEPFQHLEHNLFVDARLARIVRANLTEVAQTLDKLHLRLEKIQYAYQS
ncbi:MAG: ATPase, partial [Bacteroidetes bacterium]